MSNEEMIKAFEHFVNQKGEGVILYSADGSMVKLQDIVDLVRALQRENERLNDMKFTQEHCDLYEENEWLKQTISGYAADQKVFVSGYQGTQKENEQLKAEIERLTEDNKRLNELLVGGTEVIDYWNTKYLEEQHKNAELQKQVDELKERCEIAEGTKNRLTIFDRISIHDKAVKNTAKEIFAELFYMASIHHSDVSNILAWAKEKAKEKGVEV